MIDKIEALSNLMATIKHLEGLRDSHIQIATRPTSVSQDQLVQIADVTAQYLDLQVAMMRDLMTEDRSMFYETFNAIRYITEE
jgi:hypothetical protein